MAQQNILPDPNNRRSVGGDDGSGSYGPGFKSVKLTSNQQVMTDRTNSGRLVQRSHAYHKWLINITYNPMTEEEFLPVYAFLLERRSTLAPFYVKLPQYIGQSPATAQVAGTSATVNIAGSTQVRIDDNDANNMGVGELFTFSAPSDHKKAYMVTKIDQTNSGYDLLTITPPLAKTVPSGTNLEFADYSGVKAPLIKVIQTGDTQQYSLNSNNLYSFSLKLEEVQ